MKFSLALLFPATTLATTAATADSSVKKVIQLLNELKSKVEAETQEGAKDQAEYEDWCIKTTTELTADIKYGSEKVEELGAAVENNDARANAAQTEAAVLSAEIAKFAEQATTAKALRKEQHATFVKEETELVEADSMLQKAYALLKRSLSLVQTPGASTSSYVSEVVTALGAIIDAAWMDRESSSKIKSFMEAEDGLSLKQPQSNSRAYVSKSSGILDVIAQMQEKNAETLGKIREKELSAKHQFELLVQDLTKQQENKEEQVQQQQEEQGKATAAGKQAAADLATAEETEKADKAELGDTKSQCKLSAQEWTARKASAEQEVATLAKAVDVLSGKFGFLQKNKSHSFLQIKGKSVKELTAHEWEQRQKAAALLRKLSHNFNSFKLMQVATSVQDDPFLKVREMVKSLIAKLEQEQVNEANAEQKCQADKAKGEKDIKVKKVWFAKLAARADSAQAKYEKLGQEINELAAQLKELALSVKVASKIRSNEKVDNAVVVKDAAESIEAISGAIKVLSEFYGSSSAALLQGDSTTLLQTSQPQQDSASIIMEILSTAQEDFEKLKMETEAAESTQQDKYEEQMQASAVSKAKKTAARDGKTKGRAGIKVQINQISEDFADAGKALDAANTFLRGTKEQCANKAQSYEERQKHRAEEIKGLEEALQILSAEGESLLQKKVFLKRGSVQLVAR